MVKGGCFSLAAAQSLADPCGSESTSKTLLFLAAKPKLKWTARVVCYPKLESHLSNSASEPDMKISLHPAPL